MTSEKSPTHFGTEHAKKYDKQWEKTAPLKEAMHLSIRLVLGELPENANILCIGVGTGDELLYLADAFHGWKFTLVEPAAAMLDICKIRAKENNIEHRCTFHEGYIETLPASEPFHAATALLVSQFLVNPIDRKKFFSVVASLLHKNGYMINADLSADISSKDYESLYEVWVRMWKYAGISDEQVKNISKSWGTDVAIMPKNDIEQMILESGFEKPHLFYQALFIHAWFSRAK
ncbi:MAG: class I SAM-dependent methyltransferase [Kordiimonadaceae bacterium]|nr:class I SAM-dependent methyltransferase [Kordiimonadaceae bacterium]